MTADRPRGLFVGLTTLDVVHRATRPDRDIKVTASRQDVAAGGPAANAAVTFAALGGRATLLTAVGEGAAARAARADLEAHGVRVVDLAPAGYELAISAVLVDEASGERSVVSPDAGRTPVPAPEPAAIEGLPAESTRPDVVLLDGHHPALAHAVLDALEAPDASDVARVPGSGVLASAGAAAIPVVLDAGRWKPWLADLLPRCTTVAASADFRVGGTGGADGVGPALREAGVTHVAVTHGGDPVEWWAARPDGTDDGGVVPVPHVTAVDTLAAGDVFHGALAHALASGDSFVDALGTAARVAAHRVQVVGPRAWLTTLPARAAAMRAPAVPASAGRDTTSAAVADPRTSVVEVTLDGLVDRAARLHASARSDGRRRVLGITGAPGAGKSTLAVALAAGLCARGLEVAVVGQDGFHLAQHELDRLGRADRKGAPDTFDVTGYVALLERLRAAEPYDPPVYAPEFRRDLEEPVGSAVPVGGDVPLVVTEGNYLLLDRGGWQDVRSLLDEVWSVEPDDAGRVERLVARHVEHGRSPAAARAWVERSDEANAAVVRSVAGRADLRVRVMRP